MRYLFSTLLIALACCFSMVAEKVTVKGIVKDATTGDPLDFASVATTGNGNGVVADMSGHFTISLDEGTCYLTASYVGYKPKRQKVNVRKGMSSITIAMENANITIKEVTVTAKESTGLTSSSRIDRNAMSHLQPTSFTDLLELMPGNMSENPDMGSVNSIRLRETGNLNAQGQRSENSDYVMSALGTLFVVDGAPINNDANLQNVAGYSDTESDKRNGTNRGVDMRTISTDNIESVEIVRGIPSAEYGNLTSGMVNIKRIQRKTPLSARIKVDQYSKLFSLGKGLAMGRWGHILNLDAGYLDSKVDPRNNLENYKRANFDARFNFRFNSERYNIAWAPSLDYTGSFDNTKTDPDLSSTKVNEYKSSYNRIAFTNNFTFTFNNKRWIHNILLNASWSYELNRLQRRKQVSPTRASIAPTSMEAGVHDAQYLISEYIADYVSEGKPMNIYLKLKADGNANLGIVENNYKIGLDYSSSKNYGKGQIYDLTKPLSASWTTRPRDYSEIPALQVLSFYAEEHATVPVGKHKFEAQVGLRTQQLVGMDSRYDLCGKVYLDPRANLVWHFAPIQAGHHEIKFLIAGGVGQTTKMPTVDYLYPQQNYSDIVQLNYYDVLNPSEHSRANIRTYINDVTNYNIKAARNFKWEVRFGMEFGKNKISVTYFQERMSSGFRYSYTYAPYSYRKYDASGIDPTQLDGPPDLDNLPYTDMTVLKGYRTPTNGSRMDKQGIEFQISTARWQPLHTALTITGAWFKSRYSNSQMLYQTVSDVVDNKAVSDSYVGLYDSNDGRINEQFNTNFTFDTQIPKWKLIFSTSIQFMWFVKTTRLWENGVPAYYLDVNDGQLHAYDYETAQQSVLRYLVETYNDDVFKTQKIPFAMYVNLKATKQIGKWLNIAVFVNKLFDALPSYQSNGLTVRRSSSPYFGMEVNVTI